MGQLTLDLLVALILVTALLFMAFHLAILTGLFLVTLIGVLLALSLPLLTALHIHEGLGWTLLMFELGVIGLIFWYEKYSQRKISDWDNPKR